MEKIKLLGSLIGLSVITAVLFVLSVFDFFPSTAVQVNKAQDERSQISLLIPQGWDFFTRNPREPVAKLFVLKNQKWESALAGPKSRWDLGFGWLKAPRAQMVEMRALAEQSKSSHWATCESGHSPVECLTKSLPTAKIKNRFPNPTLCGQVGIVSQPATPWLWAKENIHVEMKSLFLHLDVEC